MPHNHFCNSNNISTHAPTKGATIHGILEGGNEGISTHAPTKGATENPMVKNIMEMHFNPRSHKGSDRKMLLDFTSCKNFNPRSHKGSDFTYVYFCRCKNISTHAPTKGATFRSSDIVSVLPHFNPRSHKGSDLLMVLYLPNFNNFNPRSHKGSDITSFVNQSDLPMISTHAPTKGATNDHGLNQIITPNFNPRSHKGSDLLLPNT